MGTTLFEGQHNVDLDSRFHIGSVTKSMTALLLMILAEEGKLNFEQTLGELLSDIPMLPAYQGVALNRAPLFPPGEKALYSNVGWAIAGPIAEEVTGSRNSRIL